MVPVPEVTAALARRLASRLALGTLVVEDACGGWKVGTGDPLVRLTVHDRRAYRAWIGRGSIGFAESYIAGWWDADDLTGLVGLLAESLSPVINGLDRLAQVGGGLVSLWRRARAPGREADQRNIAAHYDLPHELFVAMLDETMTYSCGLFEHPGATLGQAQRAKLDRVCTKLDLGPSDHVLEIGTGWGSFAVHAAVTYGCRVTTTTLSPSQLDHATRRVAEAGLAERVRVLGSDYRDLVGTYDKLVSIEMVEAVDWRRHDTFFATCGRLLRPDGLMLFQAIVIADRSYERAKQHRDFIRRMVFPGGCIPSITAICASLTRVTGLRVLDLEDIGMHYALTLRRWRENLEAGWTRVAGAGMSQRFHRLWELYLCYCEAAFLRRHISDVQMVLAGPRFRSSSGLSIR